MGVCDSIKRGRRIIESKEGICLLIKNNINSIIYYYYFYLNDIYIPFLITSINNIKEDNDKILLYDKDYMVSLYKLGEKNEYEKYGYVFFEYEEKLIPIIPSIYPINNKILIDKKDGVFIRNPIYLLSKYYNSKDLIRIEIKITEKNDKIFVYKFKFNVEVDPCYNIIEDYENNIIGAKLDNENGIFLKPLLKEFVEFRKKKFYDNNSNKNLNHMNNNVIINKKYIKSLFLALAKIKKLEDVNDNSFKIEKKNVIYYIIKFMKYYNRNEITEAKKAINKFANLYNEENINYQKLFDFISYKSYLKFRIDKILNDSFIRNQNIIQKKLFIIYEKEKEKCNDKKKQYICNSMYLYAKNKKSNDIQSLIYEWENEEKERCSKCKNKHYIKRKIIFWPEILIIILNDNNKIQDIDELKIKKYQKEYKLICCIEEHSENNNFVFYKEQNKWYTIKTDEHFTKTEMKNKINPCVLFYEKINNNNRHNSFDFIIDEDKNDKRFNNNCSNNNSNGKNKNLNIGNKNKNKNESQRNKSFDYIGNIYKDPNSIKSSKFKNPTSNALLTKANNSNSNYSGKSNNETSNTILNMNNNFYPINSSNLKYSNKNIFLNKNNIPYSYNPNNVNNTPYYIHANKKNNYNNLNSINSHLYSQRSCTPTPIKRTSKKNQNFNNNQKDIRNNNHVNVPNIDNHKKIINEAYYSQNIEPSNENNELFLNENKNKLDKNNVNSNIKNVDTKINNKNIIINDENEKEITLYFIFKNGKELYLDVKKSLAFSEVIAKLKDKYLWLEDNIKIREYQFNGKKFLNLQKLKKLD